MEGEPGKVGMGICVHGSVVVVDVCVVWPEEKVRWQAGLQAQW